MPLLSEIRGHVAILTLSRPEARNAWDEDFNQGLEARLTELEHDLPPAEREDTSRPGDPDPKAMTDEELEDHIARMPPTRRGILAARAIPAMNGDQLTRLLHLHSAGSVARAPR